MCTEPVQWRVEAANVERLVAYLTREQNATGAITHIARLELCTPPTDTHYSTSRPLGCPPAWVDSSRCECLCHSRHTRGGAIRSHPLCTADSTGGGGGGLYTHVHTIDRKYKFGPHGPGNSHVYTSSNPQQLTHQDSVMLLDTRCMSLQCHTRQRKLAMPQTSSPT